MKYAFNKQISGFTLIEILVALTIFVIMVSMTTYTLSHTFDVKARITKQANQLNALVLAMSLWQQDTENALNRPVLADGMELLPNWIGQTNYVEFTRDSESALLRVAYACSSHRLVRTVWNRLDTPNRGEHQTQVILTGLRQCSFAYLDSNLQENSTWLGSKKSLPIALQWHVDFMSGKQITVWFPIISEVPHAS